VEGKGRCVRALAAALAETSLHRRVCLSLAKALLVRRRYRSKSEKGFVEKCEDVYSALGCVVMTLFSNRRRVLCCSILAAAAAAATAAAAHLETLP